MTNLFIAYNDIGQRARTITGNTYKMLHPLTALDSNNKSVYAELSSSTTSHYITYDLGSDSGVANTRSANFLAFPSWFVNTQNVVLQCANNSGFAGATTVSTNSTATISANKKGFYSQDYVTTFTASTAYRYWRLQLGDGATSITGYYSKFFFGTLLDLERDPDNVRITSDTKESRVISDGGYSFQVTTKAQTRTIDIEWRNISNAKVLEFLTLFTKHQQPLIYLYSINSDFLSGIDLISCNIVDHEILKDEDLNTIRITCKEAI